jgi:hypothetical protein
MRFAFAGYFGLFNVSRGLLLPALSSLFVYTIPCAIIALATFKKPAMFAPFT